MSTNIVVFGFGAILLLVAILGGGFEVKELKVPKVGWAARLVAGLVGVCFVFWGVALANPAIVSAVSHTLDKGGANAANEASGASVVTPAEKQTPGPSVETSSAPAATALGLPDERTGGETVLRSEHINAEEQRGEQVNAEAGAPPFVSRVPAPNLSVVVVVPPKTIEATPPEAGVVIPRKPPPVAIPPRPTPIRPILPVKPPLSSVFPRGRPSDRPLRPYPAANGALGSATAANGKVGLAPVQKPPQVVAPLTQKPAQERQPIYQQLLKQQLLQQQKSLGQKPPAVSQKRPQQVNQLQKSRAPARPAVDVRKP